MKYFKLLLLLTQLLIVDGCVGVLFSNQNERIGKIDDIKQIEQENSLNWMREAITVESLPYISANVVRNKSLVFNKCEQKITCQKLRLSESIQLSEYHFNQIEIKLLASKKIKNSQSENEILELQNKSNKIFNILGLQLGKQYSDYFQRKAMPFIINLYLIDSTESIFSKKTYYHFNRIEIDAGFSISSLSKQETLVANMVRNFSRLAHELSHIGIVSNFGASSVFKDPRNTLNHEAYSKMYELIYQLHAGWSYQKTINSPWFEANYQLPDTQSSPFKEALTVHQKIIQQLKKIFKSEVKFSNKAQKFYEIGSLNFLLLLNKLKITQDDVLLIEQVDKQLRQLFISPIDLEKYTVLNEVI